MIVRAVIPAVFSVIAIQALLFQWHMVPATGGELSVFNPDAFGRLMQVERLWESGDWHAALALDANVPHGDPRHWSRPLDVLLIAGAWPLAQVMPVRDALMAWGSVISPLMQLASVMALWWGTRGLVKDRHFALLAFLFCFQPITAVFFSIGRPDHHALLLFLATAMFAGLLRATRDPARPWPPIVAGACAGLGVWVSIEGMIAAGAGSAALGAIWLCRGGGERLAAIVRFLAALALAVAVGTGLERPVAAWGQDVYDMSSIAHVLLFASAALAWAAFGRWPGSAGLALPGRLAACVAGAVVPGVAVFVVFPDFFAGPLAHFDPRVYDDWLARLQEYRPLITGELKDLGLAIFRVGPVLAAGGWLAWAFFKGREETRGQALLASVLLAVYLMLAVLQVRFVGYVGVVAAVPWCAALIAVLAWKQKDGTRKIGLNVSLFLVLLLGHFVLAAAVLGAAGGGEADKKTALRGACDWRGIEGIIRARAEKAGRRLIVMSYVHQGPELLYRTGQQVIGTPFHRNVRGILDTIDAFSAETDAKARAMVRERKADLVVGCDNVREIKLYRPEDERRFFLGDLLEGRYPEWLRPVTLPDAVGETFFLLEVKEGA